MRRRSTAPEKYSVDETIQRGRRASALLNDEIYREAVERAAWSFYESWLGASELADREAAWAKSHALEAIEDELRGIIADGEVAASQIDE